MKFPKPPNPKTTLKSVFNQDHAVAVAAKFRKQSLVSATDVAVKTGISPSQICLLESGRRKWSEREFLNYVDAVVSIRNEKLKSESAKEPKQFTER